MAALHKIHYVGSPIGSIKALAKTLSCPEVRLLKISANTINFYTVFEKQVKNKLRELSEPNPEFKILQKKIIARIFCHIKFPHYLHGGIKAEDARDFFSNANAHSGAETAIAVDIRNFFPSIKIAQVEDVFLQTFKFPPDVSKILAQLVTLNGIVPQGAPTSSYISNLVMSEKEYRVVSKFESQGLVYTRLIDDVTVSSKKVITSNGVTKIIDDIAKMLSYYDFELHADKTKIYSRSNPQKLMLITGLWLNRGTPKIEKKRRIEISKSVVDVLKLSFAKDGTTSVKYHEAYNSVSGKVALLQRMKHSRALRLRKLLDEVQPTYDSAEIAKIKKLVSRIKVTKSNQAIGYLKKFYKLRHAVSIVKRTDPAAAKILRNQLSKCKPNITYKEIYE
jgi:hypothetical protein